jgi:hypothetical protein
MREVLKLIVCPPTLATCNHPRTLQNNHSFWTVLENNTKWNLHRIGCQHCQSRCHHQGNFVSVDGRVESIRRGPLRSSTVSAEGLFGRAQYPQRASSVEHSIRRASLVEHVRRGTLSNAICAHTHTRSGGSCVCERWWRVSQRVPQALRCRHQQHQPQQPPDRCCLAQQHHQAEC